MADPENTAGAESPDAMTAADEAALHGVPETEAPAVAGHDVAAPAPAQDAPKEAAPEVEAKAEPKHEERRVPLADLIEERKARQAMKAELDAMRAEIAKLRPPAQETPKVPAIDQDPVAHFDARTKQLEADQAEFRRQQQHQTRETQVRDWYNAQAGQFTAKTPEFRDTYPALMQAIVQDHEMAGFDADTSVSLANSVERAIVEKAIADGANPAERLFAMAKARNLVPQPKAAAAPEQNADAKIAAIRAGQSAARGVGAGANGANAAQGLNLSRIAEMPEDEFAKLSDADFKRAVLAGLAG